MEVREILLRVCSLLGLQEDIISSPSSDEKTLGLLLSALNFVIYEIYDELPTYKEEKITSIDRCIPYASFSKNLCKVKKISLDGVKKRWRRGDDGLLVDREGEYSVIYSYTLMT